MFVRVNSALLAQNVPMAVKAVKYSAWMADVAAAAAGRDHNLTARVSGESATRTSVPLVPNAVPFSTEW